MRPIESPRFCMLISFAPCCKLTTDQTTDAPGAIGAHALPYTCGFTSSSTAVRGYQCAAVSHTSEGITERPPCVGAHPRPGRARMRGKLRQGAADRPTHDPQSAQNCRSHHACAHGRTLGWQQLMPTAALCSVDRELSSRRRSLGRK